MKLPRRMIVLVSLIQELKGLVSEHNIHQMLFIYCYKYACNNNYDFILLDNKPYCLTIYEDKKLLINRKILQDSADWLAAPDSIRFAIKLDVIEKLSLQKLKNDIVNYLMSDDIITKAYNNYFKREVINSEEKILYTIGYEGLNLEQYLNQLLKHNIKCLCDVRRNPYSQKYGFSKNEFNQALSLVNIDYLHIPDLGVSSLMRADLKSDSDYSNLLKLYEASILPKQEKSISLLTALLDKHSKIAITCFEAKISHCHRSKIAALMQKRSNGNYIVKHI